MSGCRTTGPLSKARIQARTNRTAAVAILYEHYQEPLIAYCLTLLNERADAEDIVQDVFLKAISDFDFEHGKTAWLYTVAENACVDLLRKNSRTVALRGDCVSEEPTPRDAMIAKDDAAMVREGLEKIKPRYREAMTLRFLEDMGFEEIAERMSTSTGNVHYLIHRGMAELRDALGVEAMG